MQNEKDKKMTEYFKSKIFLENFLCLMIELNEKERLHMPTWEDQTVACLTQIVQYLCQ